MASGALTGCWRASLAAVLKPFVATKIVDVTFSGQVAGDFSGHLVVKTMAADPSLAAIKVPYRAKVAHGRLLWSLRELNPGSPRLALTLSNEFHTPYAATRAATLMGSHTLD